MKLYYSPGACSLAPHIVAHEVGIPLELIRVDTKSHKTAGGEDFYAVNPKGYVPALKLDDGTILTEGPVVAQYLADRKPESEFMPAAGSIERYRIQEMMGYINSEIHKTYSPLFAPITDEARSERVNYLLKRYTLIEEHLEAREWLVGDSFSPADAYLFTVTNWAVYLKIDLAKFPNLLAFQKRVGSRPAVRAAMKAEGLLK